MPEPSDSTLPSLAAKLPGQQARSELQLTIVFHPDTGRIGERVTLPAGAGEQWLGRDSPLFSREAGDLPQPLAEGHVSREGLSYRYSCGSLLLRRHPGCCRCRLGARELGTELRLDAAELQRGVPLLLAHTVVLWLGIGPAAQAGDALLPGMVGSGRRARLLRQQVRQVAGAGLDVFLSGETGTGKEIIASAIHRLGARGQAPLVTVNMAAIPETLAAALLFGSTRGAYTGSDRSRPGYFQQAEGGTLFLDEVGATPEAVQPQLLRALQQREVQTLGGGLQRVDVQVISATDAAIDTPASGFSAALRHRLAALEIRLTPLRERREEIGELLLHYLDTAFTGFGNPALAPGRASGDRAVAEWAAFFHACLCYHWPGNVRQLVNACQQLAVASAERLQVPAPLLALLRSRDEVVSGGPRTASINSISDAEFDVAMRDCGHEVAAVAGQLGVSRQAVYRRIASSPRYRLAAEVPEPEFEAAVSECDGDPVAMARVLQVSSGGLRARLRQYRPRP